jgi:hypothetical protein
MPIDRLKAYLVEELDKARAELQAIRQDDLTAQKITDWYSPWNPTFNKAITSGGGVGMYAFSHATQVPPGAPPEVVAGVRAQIVELIDVLRASIDRTQSTGESVLEENIKYVTDPKLSRLLHEFNQIKDAAPNAAALIFRTIMMMLIYKRADTKGLAENYKKFDLQPMISRAMTDHIFERSDERYLQHFSTSGKAVFDNVAHSPQPNALADREHVSTMVAPLNKLLEAVYR